ncbi:MAG: ABC transporter ATP-binding protein [Candidatus Korarchaeum sp.]|nr:ABC transporter ATP-binding protein [Candidatus Korarchaeum sp.]MDW8035656.1 ABC transporter ATP-binding protein [Candidatus Korarchaeum sp.]
MTLLDVKGLEVAYGETQVLWGISLSVEEGEITCLVGSNGAGKTTTLRAISGVLPLKAGSISFSGEDITLMEPHKRVELGIAHIPEGRRLFPDMKVIENLKAAAYTKRAREKYHESLELIFNLFPVLRERKDQLARTLSGGEQQMLAIARGLMLRPKMLMIDEMSLGLAPRVVAELFRLIRGLKDQGYTVLLVEQNVKQALIFSDRAYVLETGRIVKSGSSEELIGDPEVKRAYLGL